MAARGNEVAGAIEAQIREAIEKMVGDIRSSIDDVRDAVNQQLQAALQSVQADANALSFRNVLEKTLDKFETEVGAETPAPEPASEPAAAGGSDAGRVKRAIQTVERGKTQVEVLNALLEQSLQFGSRAALLILKGDSFAGWKGLGFGRFGGNDEQIKRFTASPGQVGELDRIVREEKVISWDGGSLASRLGASAPSDALLVPMVIKDKIAAALYVDVVDGEKTIDRASMELLVFTTGLLIDTLAIRKKIPSPSLSADDDAATASPAAAPQAAAPAAPRPPAPAPAGPKPAPPSPPSIAGTIAVPSLSLDTDLESSAARRSARPAPAAANFGTTAMPAMREPAPPPPAASPSGTAPGTKSAIGGFGEATADKPSTQYIPPPGLARGGAGAGPQSDEAKKHDEARRFARLLVSEIKLYNEAKVEQGRKNRDLYERLKEDIDRSRQMYDERIGEDIRKASNYFYDELVRILADGDADALGL